MAVIKIENFGGISPRTSNRLQRSNEAVRADNCKLLSGELRGLRETQLIYDFNPSTPASPILRAFRLPVSVAAPLPMGGSDTWVGFRDANVDFVRTPVLQDSFERYYWTSDSYRLSGVPQYNTRARINAASASFKLGIPAPVAAVTLTPAAGSSVTRSYVYTFISAYGEEGPPSAPTVGVGDPGTWGIAGMDTTVPSDLNITTKRIYRTVTGLTSTEYYKVADVALATATYSDTALDEAIALNVIMPSLTWVGPPATLKGLTPHPGGFLIGFSGRDLYMSEPFRPHAWPIQYIQTMQTEIVGVAVYNNVIVVTTTSHPYTGEGMTPLSISMQKIDSIDPCVSRRSITTTLDGVYYSSPQGIVRATGGRTELATRKLFTREEWQLYFSPTTVLAVPYGLQYIAFQTTSTGFIFSPAEELAPLTTLDRFSRIAMVQIDQYTGDVYVIQSNQVRLWDPPNSVPYTYTWYSKEFDLPKPVNFGAFRLKFRGNALQISSSALTDYTTFNTGRMALPLNPLNRTVLNGARSETVTGYVGPQIKTPLNGSQLFNIASYTNANSATLVTILARDLAQTWNVVFTFTVTGEGIYRLPAGFKSDCWQIQLVGTAPIYSITMAETAKELLAA